LQHILDVHRLENVEFEAALRTGYCHRNVIAMTCAATIVRASTGSGWSCRV
jgi:hypothetical protein